MVEAVFVFPGQGAQRVGMGASLMRASEAARSVMAEADRITGLPLSDTCLNGPSERLTDTVIAQPGVVAVSLAAAAALWERLSSHGIELNVTYCAGHSVGELSALVEAGALSLESGLSLVAARGRLMAEASREADGSMAAVMGLDEDALSALCIQASRESGARVQIANMNGPGQVVISGLRSALSRASELARAAGAKRVIPLDVSGPFHSEYMASAAEKFHSLVSRVELSVSRCPVVLNVTAHPSSDPLEIRRELGSQITGPVRWCDTVQLMSKAGANLYVELGPGQVLSGLIKRISKDAVVLNVEDEASLEATVARLSQIA